MGSHISLFAGVGMTDIAAEEAGFTTVATAEIDPWNRSILRLRYPDAAHFDDVRKVALSTCPYPDEIERPLLVSGGFPCQDVSPAGTGAGVSGGKRSGLWVEFARVIREFQPECVLIENSAMLRSRGLDIVLHDLLDLGYDVRWDCIPAAAVGGPHLRDRMFVIAFKCFPEWSEPDDADECIATYRSDGGVGDPSTGERITVLPRAGSMTDGYIFEEEPVAPIKLAKKANLVPHPEGFPLCPATGTGFWPTPAASIPNDMEPLPKWLERRAKLKAKHNNGNGAGMPLGIAARMFPTPTKSDGSGGPGTSPKRTGGNNLRTQVAIEDGNGRLNPEWVEWMMGLPLGWTDPDAPNDCLAPIEPWSREPVARTASPKLKDRNKRLRALGNGLVWQCAAFALTMIPNNEEE